MHLPLEVKTFSASGMEDTIVSPATGRGFGFLDPWSPIAGSAGALDTGSSPKAASVLQRRTSLIDPASTITGLFEHAVRSHPFDPAVEVEDSRVVTFSELSVLAHRIASQLPEVRPGTIVPICMEPSVELIASILAVLQCGAAYTVLDPSAALARNAFIVSDVEADVVLTNYSTTSFFADRSRNVPALLEQKNHSPRFRRASFQVGPSHRAYVVYTSGSTGQPKGVVVSHGAASLGIRHFDTSGCGRWLLFFNPVFSAAQRTMLATLCKGACLCLTSKQRLMLSLHDVVSKMRIDSLGVTPSMLATLQPATKPECLRQVTTVGEPVSAAVLSAWVDVVRFRASYGLSECAQLNFSRRLRRGDNPGLVGRPSDTTNAYVLLPGTVDLAPVGQLGELCLQGPQLAEGYLGRPEETKRAFVPNPFGAGRMLRTGDTAVRLADGAIQIRGRMDDQIKVNGQRVEPGEAAAVLEQHDGVAAAVVVQAEVNGEKSLAAAIAKRRDCKWPQLVAELLELAHNALPDFMVPRFWLPYDETGIPRNANGKVDRRAVQADVEATRPEQMLGRDGQKTPVTDPTERLVRQSWADVLGVEPESIGREDSFFVLGGNSMQAIRMINRLRATAGLDLGIDAIFGRQSLAELVRDAQPTPVADEDPAPFSMLDPGLRLETDGLEDAYPATPLQESLVGLTLQGSRDYLYQRVWDVSGLDIARLRLAFEAVFSGRDIYRTVFQAGQGGLVQCVKKSMPLPWTALDGTGLQAYMEADRGAGIALGEPLCRLALVDGAALVVSMHHALFDFLSSAFLYEDVAATYLGLGPVSRPPFRRFVNAVVRRMDQDRARAAWAAYLEGAPPAVLNFAPSSHVSVTRTVALDMAKVAERASAGTVFYTAWALVLSRHLDSDDVTFATPVSGREIFVKDIDRMDGPTLTVIPRRFRFGPKNTTAAEALARAEEEAVEALKYSQHGMRGALKASGQGFALFDTMVNILPPRSGEEGAYADRVFRRLGDRPSWKTEYTTLQIEVLQDGQVELGLSTTMEEFRARSVLEHFAKAVSWIAEQPDTPIQGLELATEEEARMLLAPVDFPQALPRLLHEDFEEHARALSPYRVAMQWEDDEVMTYRMLDRRANQLASYLGARGLKRGQFACLLLDKSPLMLISILAVLKLGAAYAPLSPDNPVERNAYIAADVGAALLLSENASLQDFANPALAVVNLDEADFSKEPKARMRVGISGDDVAYVIYTSGSTGMPKGCMVQHSAAAAAVRSMIKFEGREQGEWRALQFSNYIFDASVLDMFNTLSSGGTLCMASTARLLSDPAGVINEMGVMHSFLTPTVARFLCPGDVPALRSLSIGGEPLAADILERWAGTRVVMNAYGPTETAMVAIMRDMRPGDNPRNLGKPLPTAQVLILDRDGDAIVPYGAIGELCIVGPQVGQGYAGRPDLTAAVFIDAPAPVGEYKMYRSGDLARLLPGGEIECFGRKDFQVKVNGHRIELGEIEHAVIATGEVADCVVVVAQIASKPQLAAFVVFDESGTSASIQDPEAHADGATALKAKLGGLAHYMYPKLLLPLSNMPKMPSGKADRKLLTAWANNIDAKDLPRYSFDSFGAAAGSSPAVVPTETEQQHVLQDAFAEVLSANAGLLGKEANFLALGGDSIAAMNLVSAVRRRGYELSVRAVLQQPTLWLMAEQMEQLEADSAADAAVAEDSVPDDIARKMTAAGIMADDFEHVYTCPPGQAEFLTEGKKKEKMWVLMTVRPLVHAADAWLKVVEKLTATNDILRTTYTQDGRGNWHGVVLKGTPVRITFADIASEEDRARALDAIWAKDFHFGQPFIEYALLRWPSAVDGVAAGKQELVTKMDHGLYDGTLLRIFASHFSALERGVPVDPHTTFRAFAAHHASDTKAKTRALQYWTSDSARPTGFQYPRVAGTAHPNATRTIVVPRTDAALLDALSASASAANVTIPIVFQAAFQLLLARQSAATSAAEAVGFDYLYTGRSVAALPDPQGINGNCATFLPLRCPAAVSADSSVAAVRSYLAETQDIFWRATEHAAVSLEEVYAAAGLHKESQRYRALFLFQPFEPAKSAAKGAVEPMRWVYMAGSEIRMPQPYGLVCEILRRVDGYAIKFTVDEAALSLSQAKHLAEEIWEIVTRLV